MVHPVDTNDCGLPLTVVLTSASVHDSQVAIPMMKMTTEKAIYLYDLMDAAYDAKEIYEAVSYTHLTLPTTPYV